MACQASARVARCWNGCADWLHKGRTHMVGRKRFLLSFWKCKYSILSVITAVGDLGDKWGLWGTKNTLPSAPNVKRGGERHIRGCLRGGPALASLWPLLFLPGWSGGFLRRRIQVDLGPESLPFRKGVASCRAWAPSISPTLKRSGLRGGWHWFSYLLSRRMSGGTGSSRRAGPNRLPDENRSVEEGNFVRLFHLRYREPEVALQHYQAGHRTPDLTKFALL